MATGDRKLNIFLNRLLSKTALREQFLEYLSDKLDDTIAAFFQGASGILDEDSIGLAADGADRFKLDLTDANRVGVATGQFITIPNEVDVSNSIPFENENAIEYHVGLRYASVEWQEIETNPKYGNPEYPSLEDSFGEHGAPDAVVDTPGVKIQIQISGLTESGVDHSGRNVKVWLTVPESGVQSVAFYEGVSYYSGGENYVDIPYSGANGPLGQNTASAPPSTTPGDYRCFIKGVTWRRNVDLRADSNYAYVGKLTGAGAGNPPTIFNTTDQDTLLLISLEKAYHGLGVGLGRKIGVDSGAVELNTRSGVTGDIGQAQLRLDRLGDNSRSQFMLQMITGAWGPIPIAVLQPMWIPEMNPQEDVDQTSTRRIVFTRVGSDPDYAPMRIRKEMHVVLLEDSPEAGLYGVDLVGFNFIDLTDLKTGLAPSSWTLGTGRKATVLIPRVVFCDPEAFVGSQLLEHWRGFLFNAGSIPGFNPSPVTIAPENVSGDVFRLLDSSADPNVAARITTVVDTDTGTNRPHLEIGSEYLGNPKGPGLKIKAHPGDDADTWAMNVHAQKARAAQSESLYNRIIGLHNENGEEIWRMDHLGRIARPAEFFEDFIGWGDINGGALTPRNWDKHTENPATNEWYVDGWTQYDDGGILTMTALGTNTETQLWTPYGIPCWAKHGVNNGSMKKLYFAGRIRTSYTDGWKKVWARLDLGGIPNWSVGAVCDIPGIHGSEEWQIYAHDGTTYTYSAGQGLPNPAYPQYELGWFVFAIEIDLSANTIRYSTDHDMLVNPNGVGTISFATAPTGSYCAGRPSINVGVKSYDAVIKNYFDVDWVHAWNGGLRTGRKDRGL